MLIVIREATRRFLNGRTPYATYRTYDAPWNMAMPYGPVLWGPFLAAQLLRLDFRFLTIGGELFVPVWCGVAAVVEWLRGHVSSAVWWLLILAALVLTFDVQGFTLIGYTSVLAAPSTICRCGGGSKWGRPHVFSGFSAGPTMVALFRVAARSVEGRQPRFPLVLAVVTGTIVRSPSIRVTTVRSGTTWCSRTA
jgi:hypothetical protein